MHVACPLKDFLAFKWRRGFILDKLQISSYPARHGTCQMQHLLCWRTSCIQDLLIKGLGPKWMGISHGLVLGARILLGFLYCMRHAYGKGAVWADAPLATMPHLETC